MSNTEFTKIVMQIRYFSAIPKLRIPTWSWIIRVQKYRKVDRMFLEKHLSVIADSNWGLSEYQVKALLRNLKQQILKLKKLINV